jgi:membrane associated rhomboid family serine protease
LLGLILFVFGLEALWGGVDLPPLLMRMGSLVAERALAGEWWRFVSCTFLHGGALHVTLNAVALWMLGRSLEPLLGTPRFLFIYFASGLAGSAASSWFVSSQSVGASGAIWGLLGAHAALAFYPRPLLPLPLVGLARRAAATNLVFNLVVSFSPDIDAAAHLGGGLMGALLLVLMALSGGLSSHGRASRAAGFGVRAGAAVLAVTFMVGLVRGIIAGRPWQLDSKPELSRVDLPGSPWSVMLPRGQTRRASREGGASRGFGNLAQDPSVVDIRWVPLSDGPFEREPNEQLSILLQDLATVPDGLVELMPPRIVRVEARPARSYVAVRYRYVSNTELVLDSVVGLVDGARVSVEVTAWAALPRAFDGLAPRILRSFEPLSASTASLGEPSGVFHSGVSSPRRVGEGVQVRGERSLLDRWGAPFPESGTMDDTGLPEQRCPRAASPRAAASFRAVPLLAQRVERNVDDRSRRRQPKPCSSAASRARTQLSGMSRTGGQPALSPASPATCLAAYDTLGEHRRFV